MGQKTIPQSLRLNSLKNWNSNWILNSTNYPKLVYLELTLSQYIQKFCKRNNVFINKIKLQKTDNYLHVYLHFYDLKVKETSFLNKLKMDLNIYLTKYLKNLQLPLSPKILIINATFRNLEIGYIFYQKFKKFPLMPLHFYSFVNLSYMGFYLKNAQLITSYLVKNLQKIPKHKQYLQNINKILYKQYLIFGNCLGYKIQFKGRINGHARSKKLVFQAGKAPLNTLNCIISYNFQEVLTPHGMCSLKTWLFFKK